MNPPALRPQRLLYIGFGVVALIVWYLTKPRPETPLTPPPAVAPTTSAAPEIRPVQATQAQAVQVVPPAGPVAIQDNKTIDFSSGRPVVKDSANEKAIIDRAVKEMDEAAAGITFGPAKK